LSASWRAAASCILQFGDVRTADEALATLG